METPSWGAFLSLPLLFFFFYQIKQNKNNLNTTPPYKCQDRTSFLQNFKIFHGLQIAELFQGVDESDCLVGVIMVKECFMRAPSKTIVRKIVDMLRWFEAFK